MKTQDVIEWQKGIKFSLCFERFFALQEYIPACRDLDNASVSSLPGGDKFYEATLRYYTSDETTPEKAHQIGLEEVERLRVDMEKVRKKKVVTNLFL